MNTKTIIILLIVVLVIIAIFFSTSETDDSYYSEDRKEMDDGHDHSEPMIPSEPTSKKLTDGVYSWFGFFTNSLIVISGDDVLITDPSNDPRAEALKSYVATLTDKPVSHIALTHEHYDHAGGTSIFPDARVYCHVNCQPIFDLNTLGDVPEVDETFTTQRTINIGDKKVDLYHFGPGDGDATTVIALRDEGIVLTADMYEYKEITHKNWVDDKNFTGTRKILNTIKEWDITHAISTHTESTDPQLLIEGAEYYNDLYDVVYAEIVKVQKEQGPFAVYGLFDVLPQKIKLDKYSSWKNYDSSFPDHVLRMMLSIFHGD
ncbi:MAG: MBL fold metallo-hydrolase [Candidatus Campbellbacteria bacterium]|nr:MBL fold metallo-hydrolase [Candidatus Campbellbacteria bacterium]